MHVLVVLLFVVSVSCKIQQIGSGAKKLHKEQGQFRKVADAEKELHKQRDKAASTIKEMCGSALNKRMWVGNDEVPLYKGFFVATTKSKACDNQHVTIGVQAAKFMQAKSIHCSRTNDGYLRLEIPQSPHYHDKIRVTCDTKFVDLRSDGSTLTITTTEENGGSNLVMIDSYGKWDGNVKQMTEGLSKEDLKILIDGVDKAVANNVALKDKLKWLKVVGAGYAGWAVTGTAAAVGHFAYVGPIAYLLTGSIATAAVVYVPAVVGATAGVLIYRAVAKKNRQRKEDLLASALLAYRSIGVMLADFNTQLSE